MPQRSGQPAGATESSTAEWARHSSVVPLRSSFLSTLSREMVDFLAGAKNLTRHEAYQLVSIAGHVAITQLVDKPVYGVHVRMRKTTFQ
jgi:acetamidase/formamidase